MLQRPTPGWLRVLFCASVVLVMQWPSRPTSHTDLLPTYFAARMAVDKEWADVYPLPTPEGGAAHGLTWTAKAASLGLSPAGVGPFTYHPYYLRAAALLAKEHSYDDFKKYMVRANRFAVVWTAFELACLLGVTSVSGQLLLTLLLFGCSPVLSALEFGQNTLPALAFCMAALRLFSLGSGSTSLLLGGLCAALAWACKPWCAILLPVCFLFRAPLTAGLVTVSVAGVMTLVPLALFPRVLIEHYSAFAAELSRITVPGWHNLSLLMNLERVTDPAWLERFNYYGHVYPTDWTRYTSLGISLFVLLVAAGAVLVRRPQSAWINATALALALIPLGVVWTHYFAFALPLAILASAGDHDSRVLRLAGCVLLAELVLLEYWLIFEFQRTSPWPVMVPIASVGLVSMLALWLGPRRAPSAVTEPEALHGAQNEERLAV